MTGPHPSGQGFIASMELPIEGAGGLERVSGEATSKKEAESNCAMNALAVLDQLGLLNAPSTV